MGVWRKFSFFEDFRYGDSASLRIVLHFALKTDNGRHVFLIQAFDFELYMYGVAGSLLGKVLNATETTTLASKWNSKGECYQFIQMKNSIDEKEKELKSQGGRSISERPILKKCCFKIPLQKEEGLYGIKCEFQLPGPGSGLGYQWSPSPPGPSMV